MLDPLVAVVVKENVHFTYSILFQEDVETMILGCWLCAAGKCEIVRTGGGSHEDSVYWVVCVSYVSSDSGEGESGSLGNVDQIVFQIGEKRDAEIFCI